MHACIDRNNASNFGLYTAAAVLLPTFVPYTLVVLGPTYRKIFARAEPGAVADDAKAAPGEKTNDLLDTWAILNVPRALTALAAAIAGAIAVTGPLDGVGLKVASGANRLG